MQVFFFFEMFHSIIISTLNIFKGMNSYNIIV